MNIGDIIVPVKYHPIYKKDRFRESGVVLNRPYKCISKLVLTSDRYYIPEYASLKGVTIISKKSKWGLNKPCLPEECFRLATNEEKREFMWFPPHHDWLRGRKLLKNIIKK